MVECWPRSEGGRSPHPGRLQACPQRRATRTSGGGSLFPTLAWTPKVRLWAGRGPDFWGWTCPAEPLPLCGPPLRFPTMPPTWTRHLFAGPDETGGGPEPQSHPKGELFASRASAVAPAAGDAAASCPQARAADGQLGLGGQGTPAPWAWLPESQGLPLRRHVPAEGRTRAASQDGRALWPMILGNLT